MKKRKLSLFLLCLLITISILSLSSINVLASSDLEYTFENDVLYNSNNPLSDYFFNVRNQTEYTGNYNATYTFTDNPDGDAYFGWARPSPANDTQIVNEIYDHHKVVRLNDSSSSRPASMYLSYTNTPYGTIEFWWLSNDATKTSNFTLGFGSSSEHHILNLKIRNDKFQYYDGSFHDIGFSANDNTWYHIKANFECSTGNYVGLSQYDWNVYINGVKYGDFAFLHNMSSGSFVQFATETIETNYLTYVDAIGFYPIDSYYDIGDNLIPLIQTNEVKEVNRYEFAFEGINDLYEIADDNPEGWTDWESAGDRVNVYYDYVGDVATDRTVQVNAQGTDVSGLWRDNLGILGEKINITYALDFQTYNLNDGVQYTEIFSSDNTEVIDLGIRKVGGVIYLAYYDSGYVNLMSGLNLDDYYEFNVYIDYVIDRGFVSVWENNVYLGLYDFPLLANGKEGLRKIRVLTLANAGNVIKYEIDYIGIYSNGISQANNYGFLQIDFHDDTSWYLDRNNLMEIIANGSIQLYKYYDIAPLENYSVGSSHVVLLDALKSHNNTLRTYNLYDLEVGGTFGLASLIIYLSNNLTLNYINVEGVKMTEGVNEYWLEYSHSGIDINENYFYVEGNRLKFTLTVNDSDPEWIEASFDILNLISENRSIRFYSDINGGSKGYFQVKYGDDSSSFFQLSFYPSMSSVILPQTKNIDELKILITDNDESEHDICWGYVHSVKLIYYPDLASTVITLNLIAVMIPIIIIIFPALAISKKLGSSSIVPVMLLMSVICFATELIPTWVFFIIMLCGGAFIFMQKKMEVK